MRPQDIGELLYWLAFLVVGAALFLPAKWISGRTQQTMILAGTAAQTTVMLMAEKYGAAAISAALFAYWTYWYLRNRVPADSEE